MKAIVVMPYLANYLSSVEEECQRTDHLFQLVRSAKLEVAIDREFSLEEAAIEALRYL